MLHNLQVFAKTFTIVMTRIITRNLQREVKRVRYRNVDFAHVQAHHSWL
jgi:hypothetical protein